MNESDLKDHFDMMRLIASLGNQQHKLLDAVALVQAQIDIMNEKLLRQSTRIQVLESSRHIVEEEDDIDTIQ